MGLPRQVDLGDYTQQGRVLSGTLTSRELPRVSVLLEEPTDTINFQLEFKRDECGRRLVHTHVCAGLKLVCQRCGQMMELPVDQSSILCAIKEEHLAESLPRDYEPLLTDDGSVVPLDIVEEELLLAIPMIPKHEEGNCPETT